MYGIQAVLLQFVFLSCILDRRTVTVTEGRTQGGTCGSFRRASSCTSWRRWLSCTTATRSPSGTTRATPKTSNGELNLRANEQMTSSFLQQSTIPVWLQELKNSFIEFSASGHLFCGSNSPYPHQQWTFSHHIVCFNYLRTVLWT